MQTPTPANASDAQFGIILFVSVFAAIIDWRYKRRGGKKPTARDRWMFCAACGFCIICVTVFGLMGASPEGIGLLIADILILLFAVWEVGRWRIRRKNPLVRS
jgi:quinol-cytochrome oxidoreductase complex cytochrome b subunit